jgi:hypothetical protein
MTDFSDKMDDIPELEEDGEDDEPANGNGATGSVFLDGLLHNLRRASDSEEMRESISELGPAVLAMQAEIAARGSARTLADLDSGKLTGRSRNAAVGIGIDKMAIAGQLLAKLAPTRFDIISEIPFPVMKCPHCEEWIVKDEGDTTGFSPGLPPAGDGTVTRLAGGEYGAGGDALRDQYPGSETKSHDAEDPWDAAGEA